MALRTTVLRGLAVAAALVAGALFSQLPGFGDVYRAQLPATLSGLQDRIQRFDTQARAGGLEPVEAIQAMLTSVDMAQRSRGEQMAATAARIRVLEAQEEAFRSANPFVRLAAVVMHFDPPLMSAALAAFTPAFPATLPAAMSGVAGFSLALLVFWLPFRLTRPAGARTLPPRPLPPGRPRF
ncbi:DUF2937 family protein [Pseudoxanthobacter sp.]|uniref:DUF2937 family protein n=1 Tax=Pseudoxanthobacter sp. TaxID=1925742 RepID=UPI002FE0BD6F